jgi:magnesium transporter
MPRIRRRRHRAVTITAPRSSEPRIDVLEEAGIRWIQIEAPGAAEVAWLDAEYPFHELDLEDVRSRRQRPKVDDYDEYIFVVLHFPWYDKGEGRLYASELNAFIGRDYIITLPNVHLKPISAMFAQLSEDEELRAEWFAKGSGYLFYEVLDRMYNYCFPVLDNIGRKLDDIEDELFADARNEDILRDISNAKQEIISYRKIMKPQRPVLRLLERDTVRFLAEDLEIYYDDLVDSSERIWDVLDNYKEVVEGLETTNESIINQRQNRILRILTVLTVLFLPLTFITGLFGMNTGVPWQGHLNGFWIVSSIIVSVGTGMMAAFKLAKWL